MNEHPLLAQLAQLTGEFVAKNNPSSEQLQEFQSSIATALLQEQSPETLQQNFHFQNTDAYTTAHLNPDDLQSLNEVLQNAALNKSGNENLRIFRREVPFISSQVKSSVPEWARGAAIAKTIGPLIDKLGNQVFFDLYKIVPGVKIILQGSSNPAMILTLKIPRLTLFSHAPNSFTVPESSAWTNAHLFVASIPDSQYFGLKVKSGTISFSNNVTLNNNIITVPPGVTATVVLQLTPQTAAVNSPDDTGIDAKNAQVNLPDQISFSFSNTSASVTDAGNASWKLYDQSNEFTFQKGKPAFFIPQLNRLCIPYSTSQPQLQIIQCLSKNFNIKNEAVITSAAWSLPCAALDVNNPLEASGEGGMIVQTDKGLQASWQGLKGANFQNTEWINLNNPWVLLEPGRISISDLKAGNINAKQQFFLWKKIIKDKKDQWNKIDLQYSDSFLFFYNCLQSGNESVLAQTDCTGTIDKPVNVAGIPFELKSKQTILLLSFSANNQLVYLYDDNLLADNNALINSPVVFKTQAIGLNNALLTVSPLKSFFLIGELKSEDQFSKTALIFSFGLMGYMPTLPDPYTANLDIFRGQNRISHAYMQEGGIPLSAIRQLLIATLTWQDDVSPEVNFTWGEIVAQSVNNLTNVQPAQQVSLNLLANQQLASANAQMQISRQEDLLTKQYQAAGITDQQRPSSTAMSYLRQMDSLQQGSLFSLLDVSTNADLLGINIGFINEQYIFKETFKVLPVDTTKNPLAIQGMDVVGTSRFVRIFALPQISWEPMLNTTPPFNVTNDPPGGFLKFDDDGFPAIIGNTGNDPVSLAPIPLTNEVVTNYTKDTNFKAWSLFTLPNGMVSLGRYNQTNLYDATLPGAQIELVNKNFANDIATGWQIVTKAGENPTENNKVFEGRTSQLTNISPMFGSGTWSVLGQTVTDIFNGEFDTGIIQRGVPVERYDFTGYGAQVFSHWLNNNAEIAQVSQSIFDVWRGRVAKEIIQVRSLIYPWAIRVVRTITMYRGSNGFEFRVDSGWRADSDGIYDFSTKDEPNVNYTFHPGLVSGVFNVRNIVENNLAPFEKTWIKPNGKYVDDNTGKAVDVPAGGISLPVDLIGVYFDADLAIADVEGIPTGEKIPSKKMVGYLQKAPKGIIIAPEDFASLLDLQNGLGGPVDCTININKSGQKMRLSRVEVNHSLDESNNIVFVTAAKGTPVLPKDGSWSLVSHNKTSTEITPITDNVVSLVRKGALQPDGSILNQSSSDEIAAASELFKKAEDRLTQFGFLQNTDTQKVLFRNPYFTAGEKLLHSTMPDLADAYHLMNSKGIFPNLNADIPKIDLDLAGYATSIIDQGYQLINTAENAAKSLVQNFPSNASFTFIDKPGLLKVYAEYAKTNVPDTKVDPPPPGTPPPPPPPPLSAGQLNFDLNSAANNWVNSMKGITMVVDLAGMERLFLIRGDFDTQKGVVPAFNAPQLIPGVYLKPIIDILEILEAIGSDPNYAELVKKGLQIAMSNSPNNWEYKFQADKEIPVVQFPPAYADGPTTPLRLEANLKLGVYFNMAVPVPPDGLPALSAGGFIEFGAKLSVMCVSLAAATVYAVGQVTLRIAADTVKGPSLYMKLGFGIELMVGLPVVGNVSVLYAVGIEISLDTSQITVAAFILFRGRAELFGGIVTITIQIEASGKIHKSLIGDGRTDCIAQVTFSIDVSVMFVIDINETESWQEARQIA